MKSRNVFVLLALLPVVALAQFDTGAAAAKSSAPWASFKLPKTKIKLDFRNANVDMVLSLFQKSSGITIVKDPTLTGPFTITSAKPLPLDEAFEVLRTTLDLRNFQLVKQGNLLVIKPKGGAGGMNIAALMGGAGGSPFGGGGDNKQELRVYPIKFASASAMAKIVNDVFNSSTPSTGGFPFGGGPGGFAARLLASQQNNTNTSGKLPVRASSDDFSNSLIVNATPSEQLEIGDFIRKIDKKPDTSAMQTTVYTLKYAQASSVSTVLQNVLQTNQPSGRGATTQQPQGGGFFAALFGGNNNNQTRVVPEDRSNTVTVTTTDDLHKIVKQVVEELDKPVKVENTTFVYPLANTRADQIATLLNQTFGARTGSNVNFNSFLNRTNQTRQTTTSGTTLNSTPRSNLGGQNIAPQNGTLDVSLQDPSRDNGDLLTSVAVSQGFFGQFNQNRNTQSTPTNVNRDASGQVVNVRDLTGRITVIPDLNTNSLIIVSDPDAADVVRKILEQLDHTPEQVLIETIIVEASLTSEQKLGVEWNLVQNKAFGHNGATGVLNQNFGNQASNPQGFKYSLSTGNLGAFINALQSDQNFDILSTPRIATSNNQLATINVSQSIPYLQSSRTDTSGAITYNYGYLDVGIVLSVTPRITANGYVTLDITQTADDLQGYSSFNAPIVLKREADTTISVLDGETIILGGIMRSTVSTTTNKIPILGDIPILGKLFQSSDKTKQKTELMVLLTPHIVRTTEDGRKLRDQLESGLSSQLAKKLEDIRKAGMKGGGKSSDKGDQ
ncbi:MAG: hypothetical protein JSS72_11520 [Armatimonadetes bacterium]|nr:hypothetical protein [Armatimonadota bacterium]